MTGSGVRPGSCTGQCQIEDRSSGNYRHAASDRFEAPALLLEPAHDTIGCSQTECAATRKQQRVNAVADPAVDLVAMEKDKIKGAIRTDFILSAEIVVISLGTLTAASFGMQVAVLSGIAVLMTVGVYGLVAGIVKLDDVGLYLMKAEGTGSFNGFKRGLGRGILATAPYLMKGLGIVGTAAMFTVGGGILTHGIAPLHHFIEHAAAGDSVHHIVIDGCNRGADASRARLRAAGASGGHGADGGGPAGREGVRRRVP